MGEASFIDQVLAWLTQFLSHDASPLVQFIKYALAGGVATAVHILTFFLAGFLIFPCVNQEDILVRLFRLRAPQVEESLRARRAVYCNILAFVLSNTVCYIINRLFVFSPGRHSMVVEFILFFAVSAVSIFFGTLLMTYCIKRFKMQTTWAFAANTLCSLAINYVLRKFFVFNG